MKKVILMGAVLVLTASCNQKEKLEEVDVPTTTESSASEAVTSKPSDVKANDGAFKMLGLNYDYNALEPYMDAKTVETHYAKHHLGYVNKLNEAIKGTEMESKSIEEILIGLDINDKTIRNNGGGYYNHNIFWEILGPNKGGEPTGQIAELIKRDFGSYEEFKKQFKEAGTSVFGSGWAWLLVQDNGSLKITTTANQDNPLMPNAEVKGYPVLNLDVWEHAYYLKYTNKRPEFIDAYFNLIDWDKVNYRLDLHQR